jgi:putative ABC transport system permease protein
MFQYYFKLGIRNLRRNPVLTTLMVLTLAIGVAASISTLTILHMMSSDPIPEKSDRLFVPLIDAGPLERYTPGQEPNDNQITYTDTVNFLQSGQGVRRTPILGIDGAIETERADLGVVAAAGAAVSADFFPMFNVPFLRGATWGNADDQNGTNVLIVTRALSEKLFGKDNPVGKRIRFLSADFQIVGELDTWEPIPRFAHLLNGNGGAFGKIDEIYMPFRTAIRMQQHNDGHLSCESDMNPGYEGLLASECTWLQFWFETKSSSDRAQLQNYLDAYSHEQLKLNRMPRQNFNRLYNVNEWMEHLHIVSNDSRVSTVLAFAFLLLCLVNTIGLLLAKFSVRAGEVGVRRALGASRSEIFKQFLTESAVVGLVGGLLGLLLSLVALYMIGKQSTRIEVLAHMDWQMLGLTFVLALLASILAGLLPTWRACQVLPAMQLKSQ